MKYKFYFSKNKNQKGITVLLSLIILSLVLTIAIWISRIVISEMKLSYEVKSSSISYLTAESAMEKALWNVSDNKEPNNGCTNCLCPNMETLGAGTFCLNVTGSVAGEDLSRIQAIGEYRTTKRSIEVTF